MEKKQIPRLVPPPNEFDIGSEVWGPVKVLQEQAQYWKEVTKGDVVGEIEVAPKSPDRVAYYFTFLVPELGSGDGYRYRLFIIDHGLEPYPLLIKKSPGDSSPITVQNEDEYYEILKQKFGAPETLNIVRQLRRLVADARAAGHAPGKGHE